MDRLGALRLFQRVVETGSLSRAGRELGLSQPQTSRQLRALEVELGARLINRTTRRLSLTEAGTIAYDHALRVLAAGEALEEAVAGGDREPVGRLRLSASVAFSESEVVPNLQGFLDLYPRVRIDLMAQDQRIDAVAEGVDLLFRLGPLKDSAMTGRRLGTYARILVAAPSLPGLDALIRTGEDAEALKIRLREVGLAFAGPLEPRRWRLSRGSECLDFEIDGRISTGTGPVVRAMVEAGLGVALMPRFAVAEGLKAGRLVEVAPDWAGPPVELHALWNRRDLPRKARVWLDYLTPRLRLEA